MPIRRPVGARTMKPRTMAAIRLLSRERAIPPSVRRLDLEALEAWHDRRVHRGVERLGEARGIWNAEGALVLGERALLPARAAQLALQDGERVAQIPPERRAHLGARFEPGTPGLAAVEPELRVQRLVRQAPAGPVTGTPARHRRRPRGQPAAGGGAPR